MAITTPLEPSPPRIKFTWPILGKVTLLLPIRLNVLVAEFPRIFRPVVVNVVPATVRLLFKVALTLVSDPFVNKIPVEFAPPK